MTHVLELVRFRITAPADAFLAANADVAAWVERQPGFVHRHLAEAEDGNWVDAVLWESHEAAMTAADRMMVEMDGKPFLAMIAPDSVVMTHAQLRAQQGR